MHQQAGSYGYAPAHQGSTYINARPFPKSLISNVPEPHNGIQVGQEQNYWQQQKIMTKIGSVKSSYYPAISYQKEQEQYARADERQYDDSID